MTTSLRNAIVFVTGANGGLGREFVKQSLERGAAKVYATARTPRSWGDSRIVPLTLDVTDQESIDAAVAAASDTTVVINNVGTFSHADSHTRRSRSPATRLVKASPGSSRSSNSRRSLQDSRTPGQKR